MFLAPLVSGGFGASAAVFMQSAEIDDSPPPKFH